MGTVQMLAILGNTYDHRDHREHRERQNLCVLCDLCGRKFIQCYLDLNGVRFWVKNEER